MYMDSDEVQNISKIIDETSISNKFIGGVGLEQCKISI